MFPNKMYYEPAAMEYELGKSLKDKFPDSPALNKILQKKLIRRAYSPDKLVI